MADLARSFVLAVLLPALVILLWLLFHTAVQCHATGGTVVQGATELEGK